MYLPGPATSLDLFRACRFDEFDRKFRAFCLDAFGSFTKSDWENVVVAGGAVLSSLKPGRDEELPQSDVDVFLWGLNEAEAMSKIQVHSICLTHAHTTRPPHTPDLREGGWEAGWGPADWSQGDGSQMGLAVPAMPQRRGYDGLGRTAHSLTVLSP